MFTLPGSIETLLLHILTGMLFGVILHGEPTQGLLLGILWVTTPSLLADGFILYLTHGEPMLQLKRILGLSLFSNTFWLGACFLGKTALLLTNNPHLLTYAYAIGFSVSLSLRFIVFSTVTLMKTPENLAASAFQPILSLLFFNTFKPTFTLSPLQFLISSSLMLFSTQIFLLDVDRMAKRTIGFGSLELFRAFLANWTVDLGKPLEDFFERIGTSAAVHISFIVFGKDRGSKSMFVVPYVHPGPFKNVGSSALPMLIQDRLEAEKNLIVSVPHGTSGHEMNLTSHAQSEKVLERLLEKANFNFHPLKASRMVRVNVGEAKASCQRFNDIAVVTLTLAPRNMEDIPSTVGEAIMNYGKSLGLKSVLVIDAHNSTEGSLSPIQGEETRNFEEAATKALSAVIHEPLSSARVGAFKICPSEFTIKQGIGPGGLVAIVVTVGEQTVAYVTIDGNNMVSNLRERILKNIIELGVPDGEILTTDTHVVNATITGLGYHPVGEVIDNEKLIAYANAAVGEALAKRVEADMAWDEFNVEDVKVLGSTNIMALTSAIEDTIHRAKKIAFTVFPATVLVILTLIALLL